MYRKKKFLIAWSLRSWCKPSPLLIGIVFFSLSNTPFATSSPSHSKKPSSQKQAPTQFVETPTLESILLQARRAVDQFQEYTVIQNKQEKFKNELEPLTQMFIKYSKGRVYLHMLEGPKKKAEVIYRPNWNGGKVKVHPGKFPDLTLNLDPHGSRMLDRQHHPIEHLSLQRIIHQVEHTILACKDLHGSRGQVITPLESSDIHLEFLAPWYEKKILPHPEEDIWTFAERIHSDPFLILSTNQLEFGDSLPEATTLNIPLCYATRTVLILDPKTSFPKKLESYGKAGDLYESYEWHNLNLTPQLTDLDFDPDNKDYHF